MPYKHHPESTEYIHEEYPKMLTQVVDGDVAPVVYPPGHAKQGQAVIFENDAEEKAYFAARNKPAVPPPAAAKGKG